MKDFVRDAVARSRLLEEKQPEVVHYYSIIIIDLARNGNKYVIFIIFNSAFIELSFFFFFVI